MLPYIEQVCCEEALGNELEQVLESSMIILCSISVTYDSVMLS